MASTAAHCSDISPLQVTNNCDLEIWLLSMLGTENALKLCAVKQTGNV